MKVSRVWWLVAVAGVLAISRGLSCGKEDAADPRTQQPKSMPEGVAASESDSDAAAPVPDGVSPPSAVAPLNASQAREIQQTWASHLRVPVTVTNSVGMQLVLVPPGEYRTDLPSQQPVRITEPFYLGMHEVTQEQYQRVVGRNPSFFSQDGNGKDQIRGQDTNTHPVEMVSWQDAVSFCDKLSALPEEQAAGRVYRLPLESEWEFACRAGTTTRYHFGDDPAKLGDYAWFDGNMPRVGDEFLDVGSGERTLGQTQSVGRKKPNAWGLYDMHGNVWEWCQDQVDESLLRVHRGGSWYSLAANCQSALRIRQQSHKRHEFLGFRVAVGARNGEAYHYGGGLGKTGNDSVDTRK